MTLRNHSLIWRKPNKKYFWAQCERKSGPKAITLTFFLEKAHDARDGSILGGEVTPRHHSPTFFPTSKQSSPHGERDAAPTHEGSMWTSTWAPPRLASWAVKEIVMASIMLLLKEHRNCWLTTYRGKNPCANEFESTPQIVPFFANRWQSYGGENLLRYERAKAEHSKKVLLCQ